MLGAKLKELLELPSLREAQLLTGKNSLNQTVTALSFLEISDLDDWGAFTETSEYHSGELALTSFFNIKDDSAKQCETISQLHKMGELGIILYYVGIVMPKLAPEVLKTAEDLDFVIIQMPKDQSRIRYSEVIADVMAEILKERSTENIVNEVLEKASLLPEHLRTVEVTLKLLSDMLRVNIVLTNPDNEVINEIKWPRNSSLDLERLLRRVVIEEGEQVQKNDYSVYYKELYHKGNGVLHFYLIKEHDFLSQHEWEQSIELLQVATNLWGKKHGEVSEYALVQAILNDESEKMYRLANHLEIDVKGIGLMWLLQLNDIREAKELREDLLSYVAKFYKTAVVQMVDDQLVVLLGNYVHSGSELELGRKYLRNTPFEAAIESIVFCPQMRNTNDVRKSYHLVSEATMRLPKVFRGKRTFSISEIRQVTHASQLIQTGQSEVEETMRILAPIMSSKEQVTTLCSFLLDAGADFQTCGDQLQIHKNTVKYRIKKISETLGYNVTRFSESYECYVACMIYRLISL